MNRYKLSSLDDWGIFPSTRPAIIAGPCSAESREQVLESANILKNKGIALMRAGLWKPRTHPDSFEGLGEEALPWLLEAKDCYGLKLCTEVANASHVEVCVNAGIDALWIGARTSTNPFLVTEIASALKGCNIPILIKNPVNPDIDLWTGAMERMLEAGVSKLGLIHRGFTVYEKTKLRNSPLWQLAIDMRSRFPQVPMFCDPSHICGDSSLVPEISQRAMDLGFEGLIIEVHPKPFEALSDSGQQLDSLQFSSLLNGLRIRKKSDLSASRELSILRERIDSLDEELLEVIARRMAVSKEIGELKKAHNISIIQPSRWDEVLDAAIKKAANCGLDKDFANALFNLIHEKSIEQQG